MVNKILSTKLFKNKGFTLIELLVTISIIGILTGLSLFALNGARESSRNAKRKADLETLRSALELYRSDCGHYPLTADFPAVGSALNGVGICAGNTYLTVVPSGPAGDAYTYSSNGTTYIITTTLEPSGSYQVTNP